MHQVWTSDELYDLHLPSKHAAGQELLIHVELTCHSALATICGWQCRENEPISHAARQWHEPLSMHIAARKHLS